MGYLSPLYVCVHVYTVCGGRQFCMTIISLKYPKDTASYSLPFLLLVPVVSVEAGILFVLFIFFSVESHVAQTDLKLVT